MINPNDPEENPEAFNPILEVPNANNEVHESREDNPHHLTKSPLDHDLVAHRATTESPLHRHGHQPNSGEERRTIRANVGPDNSIERSPLHPHYQVKAATRGGVPSPARGLSSEVGHSIASNTAGRSRMRTVGRGDETVSAPAPFWQSIFLFSKKLKWLTNIYLTARERIISA